MEQTSEWWETFDGILGKLKDLKEENERLKECINNLETIEGDEDERISEDS